MNPQKVIKKYIGGTTWVLPATAVWFVVTLLVLSNGNEENAVILCAPIGLSLFYCLFELLPVSIATNRTIKRLEQSGKLEQVAAELEDDYAQSICRNKVMFTPNYLLWKRKGDVCACEDILWAYTRRESTVYLFISMSVTDSLVIHTGKQIYTINLGKKDKENELANVLQTLYSKNPNMLVGYTEENKAMVGQLRKQMQEK